MNETVEANWIDISHLGNLDWEEQLDAAAAPGANPVVLYHHRQRRYSTQPQADWQPGPAPLPAP